MKSEKITEFERKELRREYTGESMLKKSLMIKTGLGILVLAAMLSAQIREYQIHERGMLHETEFNTGEIGRAWQTGTSGNKTSVPLMEWPPYSKTVIDGLEYDGQHNILGAGFYIGANKEGEPGEENRIFGLCGAIGAGTPELSIGVYSFPLYMERTENYPLLPDGSLNPEYDPDEAEEIIRTSWATPTGITITRTSRAWSYPDYDDMIIYEYEMEYTGDTDGNPSTIEMTDNLRDVMFAANYGFAPSMFGFQRYYLEWKYDGGIYRGDLNNFWDSDWWLTFNMNLRNDLTDGSGAGKPEQDPDKFLDFARTGKHGGALESPQAPGYCILYYDTTHLAQVIPAEFDTDGRNESEAQKILKTNTVQSLTDYEGIDVYHQNLDGTIKWYIELDKNYHIRQPWSNKVSTGNVNSIKIKYEKDPINPSTRWSGVYTPGSTTWPELKGDKWIGRAAYPYRQSADAGMKHHTFGPYSMKLGDKIHFSMAEVVGYGAQPGKRIEGGQVATQWAATPSWNRSYTVAGEKMCDKYIDEFGYPDYVNSDSIITVTDVARKAFEMYAGKKVAAPVWPEDMNAHGVYQVPVPYPAPVIHVENVKGAKVKLTWSRAVESFEHPRLMGNLKEFYVMVSESGMGPWLTLDSIAVGSSLNSDDMYEYIDDGFYNGDSIMDFSVGEYRYYSVVSVDDTRHMSGKTNITRWKKDIAPVLKLGKVYVVPNPYRADRAGFQGEDEGKIGFFGLPVQCTIYIYSYSGQLVKTIHHPQPTKTADEAPDGYSSLTYQTTRVGQEMASGLYFFVVKAPDGTTSNGKFVILK